MEAKPSDSRRWDWASDRWIHKETFGKVRF